MKNLREEDALNLENVLLMSVTTQSSSGGVTSLAPPESTLDADISTPLFSMAGISTLTPPSLLAYTRLDPLDSKLFRELPIKLISRSTMPHGRSSQHAHPRTQKKKKYWERTKHLLSWQNEQRRLTDYLAERSDQQGENDVKWGYIEGYL